MTSTWPPEWRHLTPGYHDRDWMTHAACKGCNPELWFAANGPRGGYHTRASRTLTRIAVLICRECPVQRQCLNYALETDTRFGVYGGYTETERSRLTGKRIER